MTHTCDTARSGSEKSENTCAACHEEVKDSKLPRGYGDVLGDLERQWQRTFAGRRAATGET